MSKANNLKENYQKINNLYQKLKGVDSNNIDEIIENLPNFIQEFKDSEDAFKTVMNELEEMQKIINEKVN